MALHRLALARLPASRRSTVLLRTFLTTTPLRSSVVLPRLKADLKDAMRSKDKPRLNVIRSIMADITNASKTAKPIDSDSKLLILLKKQIAASEDAIDKFESAQRDDLVEKERMQLEVMKSYVNDVPVLAKEEVDSLVEQVVSELKSGSSEEGWKPPLGPLMKGVMAKVAGRPVDQSYVTEKVKSVAA